MAIAKLTTEPFTCPSCVNKIDRALRQQIGVEDVQVLFNSSKVKVTFDDQRISADEIAKTVESLGYPVLKTAIA